MLLYFFFRWFLNRFLLYTFSCNSANSTIFWCNSEKVCNSTTPSHHSQRVSKFVFSLLLTGLPLTGVGVWFCSGSMLILTLHDRCSVLQRQQSLSNLTKLKVCVVTVLPCPLSFLQGAAIKFCEILCMNIWSAEVASIRMSFIYWARLRAEQAIWLPVKSSILQNTTRQTSFLSRWLVADVTYC